MKKKTQCYDFARVEHEQEITINGSNTQFGLLQLCRVETAREHDAVYGTPNSHFTHAQDVEKEKNNNLNNSQRNTCITIGTTNFGKRTTD